MARVPQGRGGGEMTDLEKLRVGLAGAAHRSALVASALSQLARDTESPKVRRDLLGLADEAASLVEGLGALLVFSPRDARKGGGE